MSRTEKRLVEGVFVNLLFHKQADRGMQLIEFETRCVRQGEIHEIVTTTERSAVSGDRINHVGFLGFVEMSCGGVIQRGDQVCVRDRVIGHVLGFDECHFPNHYNILIASDELFAADDLDLSVETAIAFG